MSSFTSRNELTNNFPRTLRRAPRGSPPSKSLSHTRSSTAKEDTISIPRLPVEPSYEHLSCSLESISPYLPDVSLPDDSLFPYLPDESLPNNSLFSSLLDEPLTSNPPQNSLPASPLHNEHSPDEFPSPPIGGRQSVCEVRYRHPIGAPETFGAIAEAGVYRINQGSELHGLGTMFKLEKGWTPGLLRPVFAFLALLFLLEVLSFLLRSWNEGVDHRQFYQLVQEGRQIEEIRRSGIN